MVTHSWKITWVWDGWNSQKKIPLYTRLGTVTIAIHLIKCITGKIQLIKDGNNFCSSCHEEQRLVALLRGSSESSDSIDPWSNATRRCSSRQLKQKLFPFFIIWTFPMIHLGEFLSSRCPVWYTRGSSSDCSSHLKPMWSSRNASRLWWPFMLSAIIC